MKHGHTLFRRRERNTCARPENRTPRVSDTVEPARSGRGGGTTDADYWTALRFALGRPGWRVETRASAAGETHLGLTTPHARTGGQRLWRLERTREGLLVRDGASGRLLKATPTLREALVEVWKGAAFAAPE